MYVHTVRTVHTCIRTSSTSIYVCTYFYLRTHVLKGVSRGVSLVYCSKLNKSPKAPAVRVKENRNWGLGGSSKDTQDLDRSEQVDPSSSQGYDVSLETGSRGGVLSQGVVVVYSDLDGWYNERRAGWPGLKPSSK